MSSIFGKDRNQILIESIEDYIDQDNEVRAIDIFVDSLDLVSLGFKTANNLETGRPNYNSIDILKLYIYGYYNGLRSSRKLEKQTVINKEVIWLLKGLQPKYRTIAEFRKENSEALKKIFEVFVDFCMELGLYGKELIAIDGTKLEASASKRKHISKNKLNKVREKVQAQINEYLHDLEVNDRLIDDNERKQLDKDKIEKAIEELKEKLTKYDATYKELEDNGINEINQTDPDAKTVKFGANQGTDVGYNVQAAVDEKNKLIATYEVTNNSADQGQLYNMSAKTMKKLGVESIEVLADKGYYDIKDISKCEDNGITTFVSKPNNSNAIGDSRYFLDKFKYVEDINAYICPEGNLLECRTKKKSIEKKRYYNFEECNNCKSKANCTTSAKGKIIIRGEDEAVAEIVQERLKNNMDKYKKRQTIIEHPFGTIKRTMNFYYLLTRRFKMVSSEISFAFFTYNFKRVLSILGVGGFIDRLSQKISLA